MRLMEEPKPEDLEIVEYWIKDNGRAWPVDEDNAPLDRHGNAFILDSNGLPAIDQARDPQENEDIDYAQDIKDVERPELIVFKLRMLLGNDDNEITQALIKTKTRTGRRNRAGMIEQEIDHGSAANLKLQKAIVEWSGIVGQDGKPAAITPENIGFLPSWIHGDLTERVTSMSLIDDEESGE